MDAYVRDLYGIYLRLPKSSSSAFVRDSADKGVLQDFTWNLFFVITTLTSIGYGTQAPVNTGGRVFCVVYIMIGLPLLLITLADLAKFCTEGLNMLHLQFLKTRFYMRHHLQQWRQGRQRRDTIAEVRIAAEDDEEVAEFLWTHLETTKFVEVPFLLCYIILIGYFAFTAWVMAKLEGWTFIDSFYFMIMSLLTVGFGDMVAKNDNVLVIMMLLLVVGLIVTTTCVDILGDFYMNKLHFFGRRLGRYDAVAWLKAVQQRRLHAMKRDAMRRLFETITALHHFNIDMDQFVSDPSASLNINSSSDPDLPEPPRPPSNFRCYHSAAESVKLRWDASPSALDGESVWYTLTLRQRTPQRRRNLIIIDFINGDTTDFEVGALKSFMLYEFHLQTSATYGRSRAVRCQDYTEPCTVPQNLELEAVSSESATISWAAAVKNKKGVAQQYTLHVAQEPAPQFRFWRSYELGARRRFTVGDLVPSTRYTACVSAAHNAGLATLSKSIRFRTKKSCVDDALSLASFNAAR